MAPVTRSRPCSPFSPEDEIKVEIKVEPTVRRSDIRDPPPRSLEDQIECLRNFNRSLVISSIAQLEEKKYVMCSNKGCRFIALSIWEMAMHLPYCQGTKGNDELFACRYCPHGTLTAGALVNHTILTHPYASEVLQKSVNGSQMNFVVNESEKDLFRQSHEARWIFRSHWRTCLQMKGYILCLNPLCYHVTCLIPEMEHHFLMCTPDVWKSLKFSCVDCCGRTFTADSLAAHRDECHSSASDFEDSCFKSADQQIIAFWKRCLKAYNVAKCVTDDCQFVGYLLHDLEKHHRYCRVPHIENYEVCRNCGAWFETLTGLGEHKHKFGKDSELYSCKKIMDILRNLKVGSLDLPVLKCRRQIVVRSSDSGLSCNFSELSMDNTVTNIPIRIEELMERPNSFLDELGKAIVAECGDVDSYQTVELSVNDTERSWTVEVAAPEKAAQVVNRKMPCYSLKRIVAGSLENSLNLLKRSTIVTRVKNIASRRYVPPKPLDFVLDDLNTIKVLREKFGAPVGNGTTCLLSSVGATSSSPSLKDDGSVRRKKKGSRRGWRRERRMSKDKLQPNANQSRKVEGFLAEEALKPNITRKYYRNSLNCQGLAEDSTNTCETVVEDSRLVANKVEDPRILKHHLINSRLAETAASIMEGLVALDKQDPGKSSTPAKGRLVPGTESYNQIQSILAGWNVKPGTPLIVKKKGRDGSVVTTVILVDDSQKGQEIEPAYNAGPLAPESDQVSGQVRTEDCDDTSAPLIRTQSLPNETYVVLQQEGNLQKHSPRTNPQAVIHINAPVKVSNSGQSLLGKRARQTDSSDDSKSDNELSREPPCKVRSYSSSLSQEFNHDGHRPKSDLFDAEGESTLCDVPILKSPFPTSESCHQGLFRPITPPLRTYLRKPAAELPQDEKFVVPKLETLSPEPDELENSRMMEERRIDGEQFDGFIKTEPEDFDNDNWYGIFGDNNFIGDSVEIEASSDVYLDTGSFVEGGLFNQRAPWEVPPKTKRKTSKKPPLVESDPNCGSKLRENDPIQINIDQSENKNILNISTCLKDETDSNEETLKDLVKYLTDPERRSYKNEPIIYMVNKITNHSTPARIRPGRTVRSEAVSIPESVRAGGGQERKGAKAEEGGPSRGKRKRKKVSNEIKVEDDSMNEEDPSTDTTVKMSRASRGSRNRKSEPSNVILDSKDLREDTLPEIGGRPESIGDETSDMPKKRRSRSNKKGKLGSQSNGCSPPASPHLVPLATDDPPIEPDGSEGAANDEVVPPRKRGRKKKGSMRPSTSHDQQDPLAVDSDDTNDPNFSIVNEDDDDPNSLVYANYRIQYNTILTHPSKIVTCAVCGESMTASDYKRKHLAKHNHICWLEGEEPMDLKDERSLERHLYNVYVNTKIVFICEVCQKKCKSAKGFLSHRKFCGKSFQEVLNMLVKCTICSRTMKPSSLQSHMNTLHPLGPHANPQDPPASRQASSRLAATKRLSNISASEQNQELIDGADDETAAQEKWIRLGYSFNRRRILPDTRSLFEANMEQYGELKCILAGCTYITTDVTEMMKHYKTCDSEALDFKCVVCNFVTSQEAHIINHVRSLHQDKAQELVGGKIDMSDASGTVIPFMKTGEMQSRSLLYLQPALNWTYEMRRTYLSSDQLYPHWVNFGPMEDIEHIPESYFNLKDESMRISFVPQQSHSSEWLTMRKLTSHRFDGEGAVLFTGGIVRSFDWFPCTKKQHIIISVGKIDSEGLNLKSVHSAPGHFQIWSAGSLENFSNNYGVDLKFEFAVCHEFGEAWDVKCCPAGTTDGRRLGLVALGTSSGKVPVYAIPLLESSEKKACKLDPVVVLELGLEETFQVTKISWSKTQPHRFVAAGFSNGLVGIWDLTTNSSLLKSEHSLMPIKMFHAHYTTITGLSFSPVNEYYLATTCAEKSTKYWHLDDTSTPQTEFTRGLPMDVEWIQHWMSTVSAIDDTYTIGSTTACLNPVRNFIFTNQTVITQADSCANTVAVNDWLNAFVCGYDSGQVLLTLAFKLKHLQEERKRVHSLIIAPDLHEFVPGSMEVSNGNSYSSTCERFGLIINHHFSVNNTSKTKSHPCKDLMRFPATAATKVCWNPNPGSFLTLATGFHSGFVIISRIKLPKNEANELLKIVESLGPT